MTAGNINSPVILRNLASARKDASRALERLASGLRVNQPSDDAAGLALSAGLTAKSRLLRQGVRNLNDGISAFNIALAGLDALAGIASRQEELATQALNTSHSAAQRAAIDLEARTLTDEYNRIIQTTQFNGRQVFLGSAEATHFLAGDSALTAQGFDLGVTTLTGTGTFQAGITLIAGDRPRDVAHADFNGDGIIDLASAEDLSGSWRVYLGNGDGTFKAATSIIPGGVPTPQRIRTGDLNGDGKSDVLIGTNSGTMLVYLGNGDGTFKAPSTLNSGSTPNPLLVDVNGDGKLDAVSADFNSDTVSVLIGNGDGTFKARVSLALGVNSDPTSISAADLNGDGKLDLITSDSGPGRLSVLFGNGDGTFKAAFTLATNPYSGSSVTTGDINGDGFADLISGDLNRVTLFLGNGDGTFKASTSFSSVTINTVKALDLNGDGILDLVATGSSRLNIYYGNGNGTFKAAVTIPTINIPPTFTSFDANGDGFIDLISADANVDTLSVFLQATTATSSTLQSPLNLTTPQGASAAISYLSEVESSIAGARGKVAANLSRFEIAMSNLSSTAETLDLAARRILDADVAQEVATLVFAQVRQQAATALLTHGRLNPVSVSALLGRTSEK